MKIGFLSYPMLFQNTGGLQIQLYETAAALSRRGYGISLVDPVRERLTDFDLIHVFSAINGNHRIVEQAKTDGVPVVVSPLIRPHWTARMGRVARGLESLVGRLTGWNVKTEYRQIESCLYGADALVALGDTERNSIVAAFGIPADRVRVIPNGIPPRFFNADPRPFCERFDVEEGFVLSVATIGRHKNQMTLAQALQATGHQVVLIGPCTASEKPYLDELVALDHVRYIGALSYDDPLLASAYAAASVFCLPARSEVMPLSVMEALAADTPVVITENHCMDLSELRGVVIEITPQSKNAVRKAISEFMASPPRPGACSSAVADYSWDAVAAAISTCYEQVMSIR